MKGAPAALVTMDDLSFRPSLPFAATARRAGLTPTGARFKAVARLALWHGLQPVTFLRVALEQRQNLLGFEAVVALLAAREVITLLVALACAVVQPAYLLLDVQRGGPSGVAARLLYTFGPEKLIMGWAGAALGSHECCGRQGHLRSCCTLLARCCCGSVSYALSLLLLLVVSLAEFLGSSLAVAAALPGLLPGVLPGTTELADTDPEDPNMQLASFWRLPPPILLGFGLAAAAMLAGLGALCRQAHCLAGCCSLLVVTAVAVAGPSVALTVVLVTRGVHTIMGIGLGWDDILRLIARNVHEAESRYSARL